MSAIFGLYHRNRKPVTHRELESMSHILAHRGSDGANTWMDGNVGLGHRMLWITPESLSEHLPLNDKSSGLTITADARIDNREELYGLLEIRQPLSQISDSELILAAYAKWGERCAEKLLGDFAFAIWDARRQRVFCSRDHFGVKPFYYYLSREVFVFASEIKGLFATSDVPHKLNEMKVADYLAGLFEDKTATFFQDILLLPAGHSMEVSVEGSKLGSYWSLDTSAELRLSSNEEYAEAFKEHFTEAVSCRLRSAFPIGSMLSGGLDSSSITCVARNLLAEEGREALTGFSFTFDKVPTSDEREYFNAVLAQGGIKSHLVHGDRIGPLSELDRIHWYEDNPVWAHGVYLIWDTYRTAQERGIRVMLDGHDGDGTVSHGFKYLDELAQAGQWLSLMREAQAMSRVYKEMTVPSFIKGYWEHYALKPFIRRHSSLNFAQQSWRRFARRFRKRPNGTSSALTCLNTVNPAFASRMKLNERYRVARKKWPNFARDTKDEHYRTLNSGVQNWALEVQDSVAGAFSQEVRYPFWDKRLVEFCLSLPGEQKRWRGWDRVVMRRAMSGILPREIQWRQNKSEFADSFSYGLLKFERNRLNELIKYESAFIDTYLDMAAVRRECDQFSVNVASESVQDLCDRTLAIWRAVSLAAWLRTSWEAQLEIPAPADQFMHEHQATLAVS